MALLIQQFNDQEISRFSLSDKPAIIGRNDDCEIPIKDPGISRMHCLFRKRSNLHFLTDLNSSNGTYVNGRRILQAWLLDGDEIEVGKFTFIFSDSQYPRDPSHPVQDVTRMLFAYEGGHESREKTERERTWEIKITGEGMNKTIRMMRSDYLVGRANFCDIILEGKGVTECDLSIIQHGQNLRIIHFNTKKPPLVNGTPAAKKTIVADTTVLILGPYQLTFAPEKEGGSRTSLHRQ